ncbi:MAG: hypothetical protein ABI411_17230 [Tahibacter sp.]
MQRVVAEERKFGKPLFVYILTLYQHGPHSHPLSRLPAPWTPGLLSGLAAPLNTALTNYLYRLHDNAQAMAQLEHDLLDRNDPTVLLHFGDHQPSFEGQMMPLTRNIPEGYAKLGYALTYYVLKSNPHVEALTHAPVLDIAYLPGLLLQAAGLPAGPHFTAQSQLRERCAGHFEDCADQTLLAAYYDHLFNHLQVMHRP